jgi:membrane protein implicated in regulation of membrane protease activity
MTITTPCSARACEPVLKLTCFLLTLSFFAALSAGQAGLADASLMDQRPIELAVLLLAILSAVTLAWWRYQRRDFPTSPRRI